MPLFTVTMISDGSTTEKDRLSKAIHVASVAAGYPENDLFQRFLSMGPGDLRVDLYYPALPKPPTDQMLMIEVMVSSGTDTNMKKTLVAALVEKLGEAGIEPNDVMVFFLETDRASGSFGGGQFAPPVAFADHRAWHVDTTPTSAWSVDPGIKSKALASNAIEGYNSQNQGW
jgi:Tautomerase enzyme